jgi:ATP-binding cassette subfamily B protein
VFQDYAVYAIPIIENVLLRTVQEKSADEAVVWDALRFVGLYEKVASAPNGIYSTVTREFGEDGIYLSGGEMQKLALARLYVKKCSLLIFDEPSSFLDPLSEKQMIESMKMFAEDRCTVMISHRLSNIVDVDRIYVIRQGRVVEVGTHSELMDNRGLYYSMYSGQNNIEKETCGL